MFGPFLKGEHVTLRPADDTDPPRFVPWFADMEVTRWLGRGSAVALYQEVDYFKKAGESKTDIVWMIEADGETVGATGIHGIDWKDAHGTTGIVIGDKRWWGRGVATAAMSLRTRYAFRELNLRKLVTKVYVPNEGSRKALEKNGYRTVGISRMHYFTLGQWHDEWLGEVLREDWEREQAGSRRG